MSDHRHPTPPTRFQRRLERRWMQRHEDYIGSVRAELVRLLGRTRSAFDADDIANQVCERLWGRIAFFFERYSSPVVLAAAVLHNAVIDFDRSQNSQRGAGAHAVTHADGTMSTKRIVLSGDAHRGADDVAVWEFVPTAGEAFDEWIVVALDAAAEAARVLVGLPESSCEMLVLLAEGYNQGEIATRLGVTRETVNRRVGQVRRTVGREAEQASPVGVG
jgi:DNA-directed RNA polymerase specialized sigma24 family protein